MAQAKPRSSAKRSGGSRKKPPARSRGSTSKSNASKSRSAKARRTKPQIARKAVESTAKDAGQAMGNAGQAVGNAASKAKLPLVAGGAALMGAAGGLAVGVHQARRHKGIGMAIPRRPQVKISSRDLANTAKEVGTFGAQMGRLASELQNAREANGKHRSPIEIVLEGLTARRSRA